MHIGRDQWECTVKSKKEKHKIFIHAANVGVPIGSVTSRGLKPYRNNEDLTICFLSGYGLMCLPTQVPHLNISTEDLMLMLNNYGK